MTTKLMYVTYDQFVNTGTVPEEFWNSKNGPLTCKDCGEINDVPENHADDNGGELLRKLSLCDTHREEFLLWKGQNLSSEMRSTVVEAAKLKAAKQRTWIRNKAKRIKRTSTKPYWPTVATKFNATVQSETYQSVTRKLGMVAGFITMPTVAITVGMALISGGMNIFGGVLLALIAGWVASFLVGVAIGLICGMLVGLSSMITSLK